MEKGMKLFIVQEMEGAKNPLGIMIFLWSL